MLKRGHIVAFLLVLLTAASYAATRDGSTMEKAIPLKQRGLKAVEEQMQWMMKLHGYTPMLATRDELQKSATDAARRVRAGLKPSHIHPPQAWYHSTRDHNGQCCSHWWFRTPHGAKDVYFDTGVSLKTPGAVAQQESDCVEYFRNYVQSLKISI